jgi:hypothetical protein
MEFIDYFHNFKCFADRHGYKFVTVALDADTFDYLAQVPNVFPILLNTFNITPGNMSEFRQENWNRITVSKIVVVNRILKLGYHVVFSDLDVSIVEDPMHYFRDPPFDYMHTDNAICTTTPFKLSNKYEGNTGFYFIRSNGNTTRLYDRFLAAISVSSPTSNDQILFWRFVRHPVNVPHFLSRPCPGVGKKGSYYHYKKYRMAPEPYGSGGSIGGSDGKYGWRSLRAEEAVNFTNIIPPADQDIIYSCHLNNCQFASAAPGSHKKFLAFLQKRGNKTFYVAHSNYVQGANKKQMLAEHGYWLATQKADGSWGGICAPFVPDYSK